MGTGGSSSRRAEDEARGRGAVGAHEVGTAIRRVRPGLLAALLLLACVALPLHAQGVDWGIRGGLDLDPDGFAFGAHVELQSGELAELVVVPSVVASTGDAGLFDYTALRLTTNGHWRFPALEDFTPFALAGASLYFLNPEDGPGFNRGSSTDLGFNLGGGLDFGALSTELWIGVGGIPDVAVWLSYTFP